MNGVQKEIAKAQLKEEERALRELQKTYEKARKDIGERIVELNSRKDMQNIESIVHQKKYQEAMLKQVNGVLDELKTGQYKTISEFTEESYKNGYIGSMYELMKQDIPITVPVDPAKMKRSIVTNSKLQKAYYTARKTPENITRLKKQIRVEMTRSVANGQSWIEVADHIARGMNSPFNRAFHDASRIVRTEGHRIHQEGFLDACGIAKDKGADIVKQWDATLDSRTRLSHALADGQIREIDKPFNVGGEELQAPSVGGSAFNVCNCRCQLLQRAKWALDEDELEALEDRAEFFGLDKTGSFDEFRQVYLKLPANANNISMPIGLTHSTKQKVHDLQQLGVKYYPVMKHTTTPSQKEIINVLSGWDKTNGSCASVGLAYIGQKKGLDVLDFRGGESQRFFSKKSNIVDILNLNANVLTAKAKTQMTAGLRLLKDVEVGHEYYACIGNHASIIRKTEKGVLQYLELQAGGGKQGWTNFNKDLKYTLSNRFGARQTSFYVKDTIAYMIDIDDFTAVDDLKKLLGYINTEKVNQLKGTGGYVK